MAAKDVYVAQILGVVAGQPVASVCHFEGQEEIGENPINGAKALNDALGPVGTAGHWLNTYLKACPENYFMKGVRTRRINNGGGPNVSLAIDNQPGEREGNADVSGVGPVLLLHCHETEEKWATGKVFIPGVSISDVAENVFSDDLRDAVLALGSLTTSDLGEGPIGPFHWCVWSPTLNQKLNIIDYSMSLKVGTQRRRYVPL